MKIKVHSNNIQQKKNCCKYCLSKSNTTTHVKKIDGASYNRDQYNKLNQLLTADTIF